MIVNCTNMLRRHRVLMFFAVLQRSISASTFSQKCSCTFTRRGLSSCELHTTPGLRFLLLSQGSPYCWIGLKWLQFLIVQLAWLADSKQGYVQTVYAGLELLLFGVPRIVLSIDFEVLSHSVIDTHEWMVNMQHFS